MHNVFDTLLVIPIINVLVAIYQGLSLIHIPYAFGFAIIFLTIVIRILLYPLITSQMRASKKMQKVAPHLSEAKEKYKHDAKKMQEETMRIYKEHGVNPAAGCLPLVIQLPIIWALYSVLQRVVSENTHLLKDINSVLYLPSLHLHALWDQHFFGIALSKSPSQLFVNFGWLMFLFPILTAFLQYYQSKLMFSQQPTPVVKKKKEGEKSDTQQDIQQALQTQTLYFFPLLIGFFSYSFPVGLSLYWNTFTIFGIIQQYVLIQEHKAEEKNK